MKSVVDKVYFNGCIYTADATNSVHEAVAVKDGYIVSVGSSEQILKQAGENTHKIDLAGKMMLPGLVDSHSHQIWGAKALASFSLDYKELSGAEIIKLIQQHIDSLGDNTDKWLQVRGWVCLGPDNLTKQDLDQLTTTRPVVVLSTDCHFIALNTVGLELLNITKETSQQPDGLIFKDSNGNPTGFVADGPAMRYFDELSYLPPVKSSEALKVTQKALNAQGVTTTLDARANEEGFDGFATLRDNGELTLRMLGAVEIISLDLSTPTNAELAVQKVAEFAKKYTQKWDTAQPNIAIKQAKFYVDGMIQTETAYMLSPYYENKGTAQSPIMVLTDRYGTAFFTQEQLTEAFLLCAKYDLDTLAHVMADGAAELTINAVKAVRKQYPHKDFRAVFAHNEIVTDEQYQQMKELNVIASLSFQWAGYTQESLDEVRQFIGDERINGNFETHGKFFDSSVLVAYGSDWPIDPMDHWHNLHIGLTRRISKNDPRLDNDRNLTPLEVVRAATINAARAVHMEHLVGSIEVGKYADLIVVDRDIFNVTAEEFGKTKVLETIVGGETVYRI